MNFTNKFLQLQCGLDEEFVTPVRIRPSSSYSEPVPVKINVKRSLREEPVKLSKKKIKIKYVKPNNKRP